MDEVSKHLQSTNTLLFSQQGPIEGTNTDLIGLKKAFESLKKDLVSVKKIAVWGGGGTLDVIREVFPQAEFFSARTGELRQGAKELRLTWCFGQRVSRRT